MRLKLAEENLGTEPEGKGLQFWTEGTEKPQHGGG